MNPSHTPLPLPGNGQEVRTSHHKSPQSVKFPHWPETGKETDRESGLDYYPARYRDAALGYWISPDNARQFPNLYGYGTNPLNSVDPDGNQSYSPLNVDYIAQSQQVSSIIEDQYNSWQSKSLSEKFLATGSAVTTVGVGMEIIGASFVNLPMLGLGIGFEKSGVAIGLIGAGINSFQIGLELGQNQNATTSDYATGLWNASTLNLTQSLGSKFGIPELGVDYACSYFGLGDDPILDFAKKQIDNFPGLTKPMPNVKSSSQKKE